MNALRAYRDDGPLASWVVGRVGHAGESRFGWVVPPLLRLLEYGVLIAVTHAVDDDAMPLCFAFLAVIVFHHYDIVYRLRHQGVPPPRWITMLGAGWDGRVLSVCVLGLLGGDALTVGLLVGACVLGVAYVGESAASWHRAAVRPVGFDEEDLEAQ